MRNYETLALLRQGCFAVTAGACLLYAVLALVQDRPDPLAWWVPGGLGALSGAVLFAASALAGPRQAGMAYDELYALIQTRAGNLAFWVGIVFCILASAAGAQGVFDPSALLAAVGTGMAGAYLGLIVLLERRAG